MCVVTYVTQVARVMKLPEGLTLYRGLGGTADLPDSFFKADEHGCRGFAEWGFMSTTASKQIAINYCGINADKPLPLVLAVRVGAADRGACIRDFSQYPSEVEYLFVPCSFVEQESTEYLEITAAGVVRVFPVRVRVNAKSATVDELEKKKKSLHMASFKYLVAEIEHQLVELAKVEKAEKRLEMDKSRDDSHSVTSFIQRIVQQCQAVYSRHESTSTADFNNDNKFRSLVLEMVTVKDMALAKMNEWLENHASSLIRFRFNAELRTVHRRYIAFLERQLLKDGAESVLISLQLLKTRGWVIDSVLEENELGENRMMAAAAEGKDSVLKLLVNASASVNSSRIKDGVTAMWLAAQFGHTRTVTTLAELKADVNLCANDGASPVYIASQGGNCECIEELVRLKADVGLTDKKGLSPVHQAAMNGHDGCIRLLFNLRADVRLPNCDKKTPLQLAIDYGHTNCMDAINDLLANRRSSLTNLSPTVENKGGAGAPHSRKIIVTTGDVSDVDGFMALAEYARTGADVVFVMNYPAYIGVAEEDEDKDYAENNPGKGYRYSAKNVLERPLPPNKPAEKYQQFLAAYESVEDGKALSKNERVKRAMTDMAFAMAVGVWDEARPASSTGHFFFYIGGVNSINPFSEKAIKNELLVYSDMIQVQGNPLKAEQGLVYDAKGSETLVDWTEYSDIYMDFNGSLAFWNESWEEQLGAKEVAECMRGVFIMGGVYAEVEPVTLPSIPGTLNRFSSATMNQLYHPECAAAFFAFLEQHQQIPCFAVVNNVVSDLNTTDPETKEKTYAGVQSFLDANHLKGPFLRKLANAHYHSVYNPPRKPFDFYAARALTAWMETREERLLRHERTLHYSNVTGMTFVSRTPLWEDTRAAYIAAIDTTPHVSDAPFIKSKKEYFIKEIGVLKGIEFMGRLQVCDVHFTMDPATRKLDFADDHDEPPSTESAQSVEAAVVKEGSDPAAVKEAAK
jgi:hypothetical protein